MICLYLCLCLNRYQLRSLSVRRREGEKSLNCKWKSTWRGKLMLRHFKNFFFGLKFMFHIPSYSLTFPGITHRVKLWTTRNIIYFDPPGIACNPQVCHPRWSSSIVGLRTVKWFSIEFPRKFFESNSRCWAYYSTEFNQMQMGNSIYSSVSFVNEICSGTRMRIFYCTQLPIVMRSSPLGGDSFIRDLAVTLWLLSELSLAAAPPPPVAWSSYFRELPGHEF